MDYETLLNRVIDDGIADVRKHLTRPQQALQLDGSLKGLLACRGKLPDELKELCAAAEQGLFDARERKAEDYWWYRWYSLQCEWVANCMSVWLLEQGQQVIVQPTARAALNVERILNSAEA